VKLAGHVKCYVRCPPQVSAPVIKSLVAATTLRCVANSQGKLWHLLNEKPLTGDRHRRRATFILVYHYPDAAVFIVRGFCTSSGFSAWFGQ
jgi:hypothetical protein